MDKQEKYLVLYNKYINYVYYIVIKKLSDFRNGEYVETAVQEIFCRAFEYIDRIDDINSKSTKSYIWCITNSVVAGIIKRKLKEQFTEESLYNNTEIVENEIPESELIKSEIMLQIRDQADRLTPEEKMIMDMKYNQNMSNDMIASRMGLSYENVGIKIFRTKRKFVDTVGKENYLDLF